MTHRNRTRFACRAAQLAAIAVAAAACARTEPRFVEPAYTPDELYELGYDAMSASNWLGAQGYFGQLKASYPFSNVTRQAQLDLIYVHYKNGEPEEAIDAAEEFERENPTHPRVDYSLYMRGLIYFDDEANMIENLFNVDMTLRPPKDTLRSFTTLQELIVRFPQSEYGADAQQRMVFLRNRLAAYENHVARYYIARGAYVAAANRAKYAVETYPGAPELEESLGLMIAAYDGLGMTELAADTRRVLAASFGADTRTLD